MFYACGDRVKLVIGSLSDFFVNFKYLFLKTIKLLIYIKKLITINLIFKETN